MPGLQAQTFPLTTLDSDLSTLSTYKLPLASASKVVQKQKFTLASPGPVSKRQDKAHPHSVLTDPTGKYLLVPDLGADLIRIFQINASNGMLTACPSVATSPGDGPRHGAWRVGGTGDGKTTALYTINELSKSVTAWTAIYSGSGCLSLAKIGTVSTAAPGKTVARSSSVGEVHVAGDFLYASNRNDQAFGARQDSLVTYTINQNGSLSLLEATNAYGWYARTFSINGAGDLLAVGGQASSTVAIISRDPSSGRLGDLLTSLQVGELGTDGGWDGLSSIVWAR
jgi:6-phosphogluconolactonase (cycloisomerase 2 family)